MVEFICGLPDEGKFGCFVDCTMITPWRLSSRRLAMRIYHLMQRKCVIIIHSSVRSTRRNCWLLLKRGDTTSFIIEI